MAVGVPPWFKYACVAALLVGIGARLLVDAVTAESSSARPRATGTLLDTITAESATPRLTSAYYGLGAWIDAFDFDPRYSANGQDAPLPPEVIEDLAGAGVETLFLQAARRDDKAEGLLLDEALLGEFLLRAHAEGIRVVAWYLPRFDDVDADLERLLAIAEFEILGHRFDGLAVDIEFTEGVPDPVERSRRLVQLSNDLRAARPGEPLGAVVPPPVQLEVINRSFWPNFPWRELDGTYDVFLPMVYWTERTSQSGYRDGFTYTEESVRRLRNNIGRTDVEVHPVGGIGTELVAADLDRYAEALTAVSAVGGSIYDWSSLPADLRPKLATVIPADR